MSLYTPKVVGSNFSRNQGSLILETSLVSGLLYGACAVCSVLTGLVLVYASFAVGWALVLLLSPLFVRFMYMRISNYETLTLTVGGFTHRTERGAVSLRWQEVERFWIVRGPLGAGSICYTLSPNGVVAVRRKAKSRTVKELREVFYIDGDYGVGQERLLRLLTEWQNRSKQTTVDTSSGSRQFL